MTADGIEVVASDALVGKVPDARRHTGSALNGRCE